MAEPLALPALLEQLAKHGLRATKVDLFASGVVASFSAEPWVKPATADAARTAEEGPDGTEALESFVNRKVPRT